MVTPGKTETKHGTRPNGRKPVEMAADRQQGDRAQLKGRASSQSASLRGKVAHPDCPTKFVYASVNDGYDD